MNAGRACVALFLLAATVSCADEDRSSDPCGRGCGWGGGSPHPYTQTSGGTTSALSAVVDVPYDGELASVSCTNDACTWSGSLVSVEGNVPREWFVPDAGAPDADSAADVDGGADAEVVDAAPGGPIGSPRGWNATGVVVIVDLGATDFSAGSSPLVRARVYSCEDRYETLEGAEDAGIFVCRSGGLRPAHVEELAGTLETTTSRRGDATTTTAHVTGVTSAGGHVEITSTNQTSPYETRTVQDCY